ncbi:hypothetical protein HRW12_18945 [Streptomyces lunaelactis]|uniref:hypothetical protein n=2 Tax=Streptomyces lunaelactis TaxID=1535768 RepID=UPI001584E011|nr:hypothetical protein [Streptomyces lunaelactis]NUK17060.1 hypothetical protein [Streptomyces lunaelactis]NUK21270.1 hypothetical protein [Streptomyces lunaelactis]NUK35774.1 hypothetical protein [Streptomyces lunaelactis]
MQRRLLALLLSALLMTVLDCALLPHESGHAHGSARTVSGTSQGIEQVPHAAAPADSSCSPTGSDVEQAVRQQVRTPVSAAAAPEARAACARATGGGVRPAAGEARRAMSGRFTLCALCRWRT